MNLDLLVDPRKHLPRSVLDPCPESPHYGARVSLTPAFLRASQAPVWAPGAAGHVMGVPAQGSAVLKRQAQRATHLHSR